MRRNAVTGDVVLPLDETGRVMARREILGKWDATEMAKRQDQFALKVWDLAGRPPGWDVTITRLWPEDAE